MCEMLLSKLSPNQVPVRSWPAALLLTSVQNLSTCSATRSAASATGHRAREQKNAKEGHSTRHGRDDRFLRSQLELGCSIYSIEPGSLLSSFDQRRRPVIPLIKHFSDIVDEGNLLIMDLNFFLSCNVRVYS